MPPDVVEAPDPGVPSIGPPGGTRARSAGLWKLQARSVQLVAIAALITALTFSLLASRDARRSPANLAGVQPELESYTAPELARQLRALRSEDPVTSGLSQVRRRQAELARALAREGWNAMWTSSEIQVMQSMASVAPDIRIAFDWALTNDPETVLDIVGSGD